MAVDKRKDVYLQRETKKKCLTRASAARPRLVISQTTMKAINYFLAFLGGIAIGSAAGILLAPEKGSDTRERIAEALRKRGIRLDRKEMDALVDDITEELSNATEAVAE